jgi:DNA repair photolyase
VRRLPIANPPNPYLSTTVERLEPPEDARLELFEERVEAIVSENRSPDIGFRFSVNPYRGCFHGCAYCYARPTHQYWGFGAGTDFESKIVVKVNAVEKLEEALLRRRALRDEGHPIVFSGNTDCYQPLELRFGLTRGCLEVCLRHRHPVGIITKGSAIRRDIELIARLHREAGARVTLSIAFADDADGRRFDPGASPPSARFETLRRLSEAGVPTGVSLSPLIPGVNDRQVPEILRRAREAGARHAFMTPLRLNREVRPVFEARLRERLPDRAAKVRNALRELRGGALNEGRFHHRFAGRGPRWEATWRLFELTRRRLGYEERGVEDELGPMPSRDALSGPRGRQLGLFE